MVLSDLRDSFVDVKSLGMMMCRLFRVFLVSLLIAGGACGVETNAVPSEFSPLINAVFKLLNDEDSASFISNASITVEDMYEDGKDRVQLARFVKGNAEYSTKALQWFLSRTHEVGINPSSLNIGGVHVVSCRPNPESDQFIDELVIGFDHIPVSESSTLEQGAYRLALSNLRKYPSGWKLIDGLHWVSVPDSVASPDRLKEFYLMEVASNFGSVTQEEDDALLRLGEALSLFLKTQDMDFYLHELLRNRDQQMKRFTRTLTGAGMASGVTNLVNTGVVSLTELKPAADLASLMIKAGLNFSGASVRVEQVILDSVFTVFDGTSVDGLIGEGLQATFYIESNIQNPKGLPLTGRYVLAAEKVERWDGRWYISSPIRWKSFPEGMVDEHVRAKVDLDDFVAENGFLPPGAIIDDFQMVRVESGAEVQFSVLKGKVLILHVWPSWLTSRAKSPMDEICQWRKENPHWESQVRLVSICYGYGIEGIQKYNEAKRLDAVESYFIADPELPKDLVKTREFPVCYVVDAEGRVIASGRLQELSVVDEVNRLLGE